MSPIYQVTGKAAPADQPDGVRGVILTGPYGAITLSFLPVPAEQAERFSTDFAVRDSQGRYWQATALGIHKDPAHVDIDPDEKPHAFNTPGDCDVLTGARCILDAAFSRAHDDLWRWILRGRDDSIATALLMAYENSFDVESIALSDVTVIPLDGAPGDTLFEQITADVPAPTPVATA